MESIKASLYQLCLQFINERIANATLALQQAREASNDDTKSSAGDKYETSREMAQQDIDRNKRLLMDAEANLHTLEAIKDLPKPTDVRNGSLVYTNNGNFFLSISAGQINHQNISYFAISAVSPIGKLLIGKKIGEGFEFNGRKYSVNEII